MYIENKSTKVEVFFFGFEREFQLMASAPDDSSLSSDQDTNQFYNKPHKGFCNSPPSFCIVGYTLILLLYT